METRLRPGWNDEEDYVVCLWSFRQARYDKTLATVGAERLNQRLVLINAQSLSFLSSRSPGHACTFHLYCCDYSPIGGFERFVIREIAQGDATVPHYAASTGLEPLHG